MRLITAQLGSSKWHIVGVKGEGRDAFVSLQSSIAFDDREQALAYIEQMEKETAAPEPSADPAPAEQTARRSLCAAIDLSSDASIIAAQNTVKSTVKSVLKDAPVEWNEPPTFHITLAYSPDADDATAARVMSALEKVPPPPLSIEAIEPDVFDTKADGFAIHYRVNADAALKAYQAAVYDIFKAEVTELSPFSIPADWKPHITMGYSTEKPPAIPAADIKAEAKGLVLWHESGREIFYAEPVEKVSAVPAPEPVVKGVDMGAPDGDVTAVQVIAAGTATPILSETIAPRARPLSVLERIRKGLQRVGVIAPEYTIADVMERTGIKSLGGGLWIGAFTNNFKDRDGEIIRESALDGMIDRMRAEIIPYPELWHAHKWYTKHGAAFFVARAGNIVYAVGTFDRTPLGVMMEKHYNAAPGRYAMSHGFTFPEWGYDEQTKTYSVINTFEISTLPPEMAANLYTPFAAIGEVQKMLTVNERKELEKTLGPEIVAQIAAQHKNLETASGQIKKYIGAEYKDFVKVPVTAPAAPVQTAVETAPVETAAAATDTDADAKADVTVDADAFGMLLNDLMASQVDTMNLVSGMAERLNQQDALIREMAAALGYEDVPASESPETEVTEAEAELSPDTAKGLNDAKAAIGKKRVGVDSQYSDVPALASMFDAPQ